jgi:hypothetical protein
MPSLSPRDIPTPRRSRRKSIKKIFGQTSAGGKAPVPVRVTTDAAAAVAHGGAESLSSAASAAQVADLNHQINVLERHAEEHRRKSLQYGTQPSGLLEQLKEETKKAAKVPNLEHKLEQSNLQLKEALATIQRLTQTIDNEMGPSNNSSNHTHSSSSNSSNNNNNNNNNNINLDQKNNDESSIPNKFAPSFSNQNSFETKVPQHEPTLKSGNSGSGTGPGPDTGIRNGTGSGTGAPSSDEKEWNMKLQVLQHKLDVAENQLRLSRMITTGGGTNDDKKHIATTTTTTTREQEVRHSHTSVRPQTRSGTGTRASRDDWRRFAEEKREMTQRFNLDRAALAAENHRMRAALTGKPPVAKNSEKDKYIVRLQSELSSERMLKKAAEQETSSLATQLQRMQGNSSLATLSARSVGESTLIRQLRQKEQELETLRHEQQSTSSSDGSNANWISERAELMTNWNVRVVFLSWFIC